MWLVKVKESHQFQFFASYAIDIHANEFHPLIKLLLFVPQGEDLSLFSFVRGTNLFSVSKFTCSPKKKSEKIEEFSFRANPCTVCFVYSFILGFCNE